MTISPISLQHVPPQASSIEPQRELDLWDELAHRILTPPQEPLFQAPSHVRLPRRWEVLINCKLRANL